MLVFVKLLAPVIAGGVVAGGLTFGVVQTQTSAPSDNPASSDIISYGDKS